MISKITTFLKNKYLKVLIVLLLVLTTVVVVRNAWICDDAYISYRVIDNFSNGFGLRWNVAERVQTFTHPLWLFLLILFYKMTGEIFFTSLLVSIALIVLTIAAVVFLISKSDKSAIFAIVLLMFSKAFIDYSTSGLENPMTFFLLAAFFGVFIKMKSTHKKFFIMSLISGLGMLNRMDSILLFFPSLLFEFSRSFKFKMKIQKSILLGIAGFLPFFVWEIFSIIYFGFPFPNTAYAKLSTGVATSKLVEKGLFYLVSPYIGLKDLITPSFIVVGIVAAFLIKEKKVKFIAIGMLLYVAYIIKIGGDFMLGRFLSAPLLCAVIILSRATLFEKKRFLIPSIALILALGFVSPNVPIRSGADYSTEYIKDMQVVDERGYYYSGSSLLKAINGEEMPSFFTVDQGKLINLKQSEFITSKIIGFLGFYAGSKVYIVDPYALSDPLLARLPIPNYSPVKPGHYERLFPDGYLPTIADQGNFLVDTELAQYYDELLLITRGNLFDMNRLISIFKMNTGQFDYLMDAYKNKYEFYRPLPKKQ